MSEFTTRKSHLGHSKIKIYSVTAGEQKARSALSFNAYGGDFSINCSVKKDNDDKGSMGVFIPVGMDIFTAQQFIDCLRSAATTEGPFEAVTILTTGASSWDTNARRRIPGELKNKLTIFKRPNGVVCIAFEDVAKEVKTDIQLLNPNKESFHTFLINKEPVGDALKSRMLTLAMCRQLEIAIALEAQRTYVPYDPNATNQKGNRNNSGGAKKQSSAPQSDDRESLTEDDIPY